MQCHSPSVSIPYRPLNFDSLGHGALAFSALDPPTSGRIGELRDKVLEHYGAVFRVAVCCIFGLPSYKLLSTFRPPTACASWHLSVNGLKLRGVHFDMLDDAWAIAFANHLARCGGDTLVHTAHS
jgi:hypothetical protein